MKQWLQNQIDNGFTDLKGLSITARIPARDALINELLKETIHGLTTGGAASTTPGTVDFRSLLKFIDKAEVSASDGVITLDVVIKV